MSALCQLWAAAPAASVKGRLGLDQFDVADDVILNTLIAWVGERFEAHCGRSFDRQADITEEFDADLMELAVNRPPIEAVSAFALKDNEDDGFVEITEVDYLLVRARNGVACIVRLSSQMGNNFQRLRVTYTGGYVLPGATVGTGQTGLPSAIEGAAIEQVAFLYQRRNSLGLSGVSGQGGGVQLNPQSGVTQWDLLPQVANTLAHYRRLMTL